MKILDRLFARASPGTVRYQMVTERGNGWRDCLYGCCRSG